MRSLFLFYSSFISRKEISVQIFFNIHISYGLDCRGNFYQLIPYKTMGKREREEEKWLKYKPDTVWKAVKSGRTIWFPTVPPLVSDRAYKQAHRYYSKVNSSFTCSNTLGITSLIIPLGLSMGFIWHHNMSQILWVLLLCHYNLDQLETILFLWAQHKAACLSTGRSRIPKVGVYICIYIIYI